MKTLVRIGFGMLAIFVVMMWAMHIIPNLHGATNWGRSSLLWVLIPETATTLLLGLLILCLHDLHPAFRLLLVPFGMAMMAMVHGLFFFTDGSPDTGLYAAFGVVSGLLLGTPLGIVLVLVDWFTTSPSQNVPAARNDFKAK